MGYTLKAIAYASALTAVPLCYLLARKVGVPIREAITDPTVGEPTAFLVSFVVYLIALFVVGIVFRCTVWEAGNRLLLSNTLEEQHDATSRHQ